MRFTRIAALILAVGCVDGASVKRQNGTPGFGDGQPIDGNGKGAPILGMEVQGRFYSHGRVHCLNTNRTP